MGIVSESMKKERKKNAYWGKILKVNKSVYIASHTYGFCWQYAIILIWKMWSSSLNQLNR